MLKENLFFRADDDTDFMPIIPINEQDGEQDKNLIIPDILPILPLRNTVLFPGVVLPITVGRDKSIKAVNDAYKQDKLIGVVAQKDANMEEPTASDLCKIGTVAKIVKLIKMVEQPSSFKARKGLNCWK
jgi:ATP-dependent Lon protease